MNVTESPRPWAPALLDRSGQRVALIDPSGTLLECSESFLGHLGIRREDAVGRDLTTLRTPSGRKNSLGDLVASLALVTEGRGVRYGTGSAAEPFEVLLTAVTVRSTPGDPVPGVVIEIRPGGVDVTERAKDRLEYTRLLRAERLAHRRTAALHRVTTALSEAVTAEQVAAVTVEESLSSLGADAARVELWQTDRSDGAFRPADVIRRTAGPAHLLTGSGGPVDSSSGFTRLTLPLGGRGQHRGEWILAWTDRPDWPDLDDADVLRTLTTECTQAVERAELHDRQRDIATVLQSTLLPPVLRSVQGAGIAARHQPGGQGLDVGGDWYDVIDLPEGRTGFVIGDVEGRSTAAAAVMGQVRNALRAYSVEGAPPALVMGRLNRLLTRLQISQLISCCYLEFDPSEGTATIVLAGHPPPLLLRPDGSAEFVSAHPNLMLGVDDATHFAELTVLLDPAACLLLYTDGLIETVDRSLPEGLASLRRWAGARDADESLDEFVERLIRLARDGQQIVDDVALLALQYHPAGRIRALRHRSVRRSFPLDPASASSARRFVNDVLDQWRLGAVAAPVTLMTSELVANSVQHTSGRLEVALHVDDDRLRVEVVDHCERLPTVQTPGADGVTGRGLLIIEILAHRWGADSRPFGKAVWFEVLLDDTPRGPVEPE